MNRLFLKFVYLFIIFLAANSALYAQSQKSVSDQDIDKWFKSEAWSGGLKLKVFADVNKREFYTQYHKNRVWWDKAFAYLRDHDLDNHVLGKTLIEGDSVFISVTEAPGKAVERTLWETHRKMIDLQYIVRGKEEMRVADAGKMTVTMPYNETRDLINYTGEGKSYIAEPGTYYLFFPTDAHRPSIDVDGKSVKKAVIKIRYSGK